MDRKRRLASKVPSARALLVFVSLFTAMVARPVAAADHAPAESLARWAGAFRYAGDAEEQAALARAIDAATADMGVIARHIARGRLEREMRPDPKLVVRIAGTTVGIGAEGNWATTLDGPARVFEDDGERYRVRHLREGPAVVQIIEDDAVSIRKSYVLSEDGSGLRVSVRFAHDRLSAPLRYALTYRRAS